MMRLSAAVALLACGVSLVGCASTAPIDVTVLGSEIRERSGAAARVDGSTSFGLPPGLALDDGLSSDEAVGVALWNNAGFQQSVAELGFSRADLADAGLLTNPVLSLLFPLGPKQLEATLRWPVELLWERPRRVKAAQLSVDEAGQRLVQSGLELALAARLAHADLALAVDRLRLTNDTAALFRRIDELAQSRLAAGDIAQIEARLAHVDALRTAQDAARAVHDATIARERLRALLGLPTDHDGLERLQPSTALAACGDTPALLQQALAARPDLRAAEIHVEAAAARLGWQRARILSLTAVLDANGAGRDGFEAGPGLETSIPVFNRNQGGRLRAQAELQSASGAYVSTRQRIALDVREAVASLAQARESRRAWNEQIVGAFEMNLAGAERAYREGETSYLFVLENSRGLADARLRARELEAEELRAHARLERAIGSGCREPQGNQP